MWPALLVLAAASALKFKTDRDALKRQQQLSGAMGAYQRKKSDESMAATEQLLKKQTPEARATELADTTGTREQSLRDTVGAAQAFDAAPIAGKLSSEYGAAQEKEAANVAERTKRAITQLATMGAPGEQKLKHQLRFGKAAGDVDAANAASENVGRHYMSDISNVRPNALAGLASQIGMGVGGGMLAGAPGAAAGSVNNGQGFEDASGNLYDENATTSPTLQDERIRRQMQMNNALAKYRGVLG